MTVENSASDGQPPESPRPAEILFVSPLGENNHNFLYKFLQINRKIAQNRCELTDDPGTRVCDN